MRKFLRKIVVYANLAFALLLICSFTSRYISPAVFWPPAFLGLAYPYFLVANIIFIVFWLFRKRKEFLISLMAILLGWHTLTAYISLHPFPLLKKQQVEQTDKAKRSDRQKVKLMSFNVRAFNRYDWAENPATRNEILKTIKEEDADIVCLQEFYSTNRGSFGENEILQKLDNTPFRHIEYSVRREWGRYGIATLSSNPIIHSGLIGFENTINISIYTDIRMGKDTIRVYNNHLQSIYFDKANYRFLDSLKLRYDNQQLEEIRAISFRLRDAFIKRAEQADLIPAHIKECPYRVIVCGDLNDTPVSYAYYRLSRGLSDTFTKKGWGTGRTYIGKFPSFRIDYILYGRGFEAISFEQKKVLLSDHFPIISILQLL